MRYSWNVLTIVLLAVGGTATARAGDPDANRLKESLAKWEKAREACAGDYSYRVTFASFTGKGHITTITVKGNKVVERKYEKFDKFDKPEGFKTPKLKWVETGKDLGSHKTEGAPVRTVDELYDEAKKVVETKVPKDHRRELGFDKQGLLKHCFTVDTRFVDDALGMGVPPFEIQLKPKG